MSCLNSHGGDKCNAFVSTDLVFVFFIHVCGFVCLFFATCLDSFDSNKDGAFVSTYVVHLSLPNLPEVALPQHLEDYYINRWAIAGLYFLDYLFEMNTVVDVCLFVIESKMNTMGMVGWLMYNDDDRLFVCLFVCLFVVDSRWTLLGLGMVGWWMYNDDDRL